MSKQISRRSFIKGVGGGLLGAASVGLVGGLGAAEAEAVYIPGTYTAIAQGIGEVKVSMTFSATQITHIQVDTSAETAGIGQEQGAILGEQILTAQGTQIDSVSGATVTCDAVRAAADDCIGQALIIKPAAVAREKTWRDAPAPIADDKISQVIDADILVVGMGYAGITALRAAAETRSDITVIGLEARTRDNFWCVGHDIGHINSKALERFGVPKVDEVEFLNNWQLQTHNKSNPALVMQFAKNSGAAIDWVLDAVPEEIVDKAIVTFWPETENAIHQMNNGLRYYPGTLQWWTDNWENNGAMMNNGPGLECKDVMNANLDYIAANLPNAQVHYGVRGEQLVLQDNEVTGLVAVNERGEYVKYNARKVILTTGGFGGNKEMCKDLLPACERMRCDLDSELGAFMGRDGSGIKMGVWAGGRLEPEISTMNFDSTSGPDSFPSLWLDEDARRYCNEGFAGPEIGGFLNARLKRRQLVSVYDSRIDNMLSYAFPGHGSFEPAKKYNVDNLKANLSAAYEAGAASDNGYFAADDLATLADYLGYDEGKKERFLEQIEHYNQLCEQGVDSDFGKDARLMFPIQQGPFYAHVSSPTMGSGLVTTGGFVTTNDQQVLDQNYKPIPGLYASGNTCGMRFGPAYVTPIPGVSIGIALTMGRLCGIHCANTL